MQIIKRLLNELSLTVINTFTSGHKCQSVYKVRSASQKIMVLKVGTNPQSVAEIAKNLRGYRLLKESGLDFFIPKIEASSKSSCGAFILMEYCGTCFSEAVERSSRPRLLYERLAKTMLSVYSTSKTDGTGAKTFLSHVHNEVRKQYSKYLQREFDPTRSLRPLLEDAVQAIDHNYQHCCFASWDFTPQNVFLARDGVKYIDPNDVVTGIPIVDLACFAGMVRDVQKLPDGMNGYRILEESAYTVGNMLELSEENTCRLFNLGRVLQNFLSARFRIEKKREKAAHFFEKGREHLERIIK